MNAKSRLWVNFETSEIVMNSTFVKEMRNPMSDEYMLLQRTRVDYPVFSVKRRKINSNPKKDTYKGLTYEWMRNHIATHETEKARKLVLEEFDEMVHISKCHRQSLRYPTIKKWFLAKYPDVAKFGTIDYESEAQQEEETNEQKVISLQAENQSDDQAA